MYAWTPVDLDVIVAQSAATLPKAIDPVSVALLLWIESAGFDPANPGPSGANPQVGGLNQMSVPNLTAAGLTRASWLTMSAAQQLPFIFKFWKGLATTFNGGRFPADGARLLALNFLPKSYQTSGADTNDAAVVCGKAGPYAQFYAGNAFYDPLGTGQITVASIARRQGLEAAKGGARYAQLVADIAAAVKRAGSGTTAPPTLPTGGSQTPPPGGSSSPPSAARSGGGGLIAVLALAVVGVIAKVRA